MEWALLRRNQGMPVLVDYRYPPDLPLVFPVRHPVLVQFVRRNTAPGSRSEETGDGTRIRCISYRPVLRSVK
jgi:hypothetical protein